MNGSATPAARLAAAGIVARKRLGQHFLLDPNLCRRIARAADPAPDALVLEVGPGPGGLTRALLEAGATVLAIEKDERFLPLLQALAEPWPDRLSLVHADALKVDELALGAGRASVAANLPYNVGTALLIKWLLGPFRPGAMTLMFQKEVAERIVARPGERAFGRLAVMTQTLCEARIAFTVPARAFTPPPKVDSAVVRLDRRAARPSEMHLRALQRITEAAFGQRRKMLRSALAALGGEALCQRAGVAPTHRGEQLDLAQFHALAEAFAASPTGTAISPGRFLAGASTEDAMDDTSKTTGSGSGIQGEGDYDAARRFDRDERAFIDSGKVDENARKAADALDGPEGDELERARKSTAEGLAANKDD